MSEITSAQIVAIARGADSTARNVLLSNLFAAGNESILSVYRASITANVGTGTAHGLVIRGADISSNPALSSAIKVTVESDVGAAISTFVGPNVSVTGTIEHATKMNDSAFPQVPFIWEANITSAPYKINGQFYNYSSPATMFEDEVIIKNTDLYVVELAAAPSGGFVTISVYIIPDLI